MIQVWPESATREARFLVAQKSRRLRQPTPKFEFCTWAQPAGSQGHYSLASGQRHYSLVCGRLFPVSKFRNFSGGRPQNSYGHGATPVAFHHVSVLCVDCIRNDKPSCLYRLKDYFRVFKLYLFIIPLLSTFFTGFFDGFLKVLLSTGFGFGFIYVFLGGIYIRLTLFSHSLNILLTFSRH